MTDKTIEENARDMLLEHVQDIVRYWVELPDVVDSATGEPLTIQRRCDGVAFSILASLDGCAAALPFAVDLITRVHADDEDQTYADVLISDMLHEHYAMMRPSK